MTLKEQQLLTLVNLLKEEVESLRSVLSEWEQDKSCFIQYNRANIISDCIAVLHKGDIQ